MWSTGQYQPQNLRSSWTQRIPVYGLRCPGGFYVYQKLRITDVGRVCVCVCVCARARTRTYVWSLCVPWIIIKEQRLTLDFSDARLSSKHVTLTLPIPTTLTRRGESSALIYILQRAKATPDPVKGTELRFKPRQCGTSMHILNALRHSTSLTEKEHPSWSFSGLFHGT